MHEVFVSIVCGCALLAVCGYQDTLWQVLISVVLSFALYHGQVFAKDALCCIVLAYHFCSGE